MYERCCKDTDYCVNRSKTVCEPPQRMDDIMEVSGTPTSSFDITDMPRVRGDRSSRSPHAMHGHRKRSQTLESELLYRNGNQSLGVETSHLAASVTAPSGLSSSAVFEPDSEIIPELASETIIRTPEVTILALPVETNVHGPPSGEPKTSKESPQPNLLNAPDTNMTLTPGTAFAEDTARGQRQLHAEAEYSNGAVTQTSRPDDMNQIASNPQQPPQLPEPASPMVASRRSKRRRFKDWVSKALESVLPEKDQRATRQPGTQRRSMCFN